MHLFHFGMRHAWCLNSHASLTAINSVQICIGINGAAYFTG